MLTSPKLAEIESKLLRSDLPDFRGGDTVRVHYRIVEGDKERTQVFQGVVIKRSRSGARSTFTVRKVSFSVGVERIFLSHSPRIEKVESVLTVEYARELWRLRGVEALEAHNDSSMSSTDAPRSASVISALERVSS